MEGGTENRILRAIVFSIGAALVVLAFAYVVVSVADLIAYGNIYLGYDDWGIMGGAFVLSLVGVLCMTLARSPATSHPSDRAEKAQ